jgi:hypothetical protein
MPVVEKSLMPHLLLRLQQKDLDARWVKKNDINHYAYKNGICIDAEHVLSDAL